MRKVFALFLTVILLFVAGCGSHLSAETAPSTEEDLICPSEWFVTDEKPSRFTDETCPPMTEPPIEATEPLTEPPTEPPTEPAPTYPPLDGINWYSDFRTWVIEETITTTAGGLEFDKEFLAKLLHEEAGSIEWTGQVYVCSAILNFCDVECVSLWKAGHNPNMFSVASYVDYAKPDQMQYDVIDYVINGGRVYGVTYFRTRHYHNFGTPTCRIENVYFSH